MHPRDGSGDMTGRFRCGQYQDSYETKEFIFPHNLTCDRCTVQLVWENGNTVQYQCADITLMGESIRLCMDKCQNAGVCANGACVCQEQYYGTFCEHKCNSTFEPIVKQEAKTNFIWILYVFLILAIIVLLGISIMILHNRGKGKARDPLTNPPNEEGFTPSLGDHESGAPPKTNWGNEQHGPREVPFDSPTGGSPT